MFSFTWQEVDFKQTDLNQDLTGETQCSINCIIFSSGKYWRAVAFVILDFTFWKPGHPMRTSGRMSNAKSWLGLGMSLYFWGLMDLTTPVLSGKPTPPGKLEVLLSDKPQSHPRTKRSWVWNQFFVLEEYTGTDPLYVGKVRTAKGNEKLSEYRILKLNRNVNYESLHSLRPENNFKLEVC